MPRPDSGSSVLIRFDLERSDGAGDVVLFCACGVVVLFRLLASLAVTGGTDDLRPDLPFFTVVAAVVEGPAVESLLSSRSIGMLCMSISILSDEGGITS